MSTKSEDSIVATLRGLGMADGKEKGKSKMDGFGAMGPPRSTTPGTFFADYFHSIPRRFFTLHISRGRGWTF